MAQTKKDEVRDAILSAAQALFEERGYNRASMSQIASAAGTSPANIYVYFASKLDVLFALYDPWLRARLIKLRADVAAIEGAEDRLRFILKTLWHDIPGEENCFANNLMQALSTATPDDRYSRDLLHWAEEQVSQMIAEALPVERRHLLRDGSLAHVIFMAFDGFAMNHRLNGPSTRIDHSVALMLSMLLEKTPGT